MKYGLGTLSGALRRGERKAGQSLLRWNTILAVFFAAEGVALLLLSMPRDVALYISYLANDPLQTSLQHTTVTAAAVHQLSMINSTYIVAALCFVAALAHIVRVTIRRKNYEARLKQKHVLLHPLQLASEAAVLFVLLGLLGGMYDIGSLILAIACAAVLGLVLSLICTLRAGNGKLSGNEVATKAVNIVWLAGLVPLAVILLHMVAGNIFGAHTPVYLYITYASTIALGTAIAINVTLAERQAGKQQDISVRRAEWRFMAINAVGITLICVVLFAGLLRP